MLLFVVFALLVLSALEDIEYLSVPQVYLYLALALSTVYGLRHAHYAAVAFAFLALGWTYRRLPALVLLLLAAYPPAWPLVVLGAGKREEIVGEGDLLAVAALFLVSPWAGWAGFAGLVVFWRLSKRRSTLWGPAIPGVLVGALPFLMRW